MFGQWGRKERGEGGKEKKGNSTVIHNVKLGKLRRKKNTGLNGMRIY